MKINVLASFLICLSLQIHAQTFEKIDSIILIHQAKGFNGNIFYSKGDTIKHRGNYGYKDFETKVPLNDSTIFDLASCSKQFTALAIVQLVEKEKITYATTVDQIIEGFPYPNVTIEHLLRHQSGLPDYMKLFGKRKVWNKEKIATNQDVIEVFKKFKPKKDFEPGTDYDYSNTGYLILASIIEEVSQQSYTDYLEEHIFMPAQMHHTRVYRRRYQPKTDLNTSEGHTYNKREKRYKRVDFDKKQRYVYWLDGIVGDGMVNSTILDLEKWKQALRYNKLIKKTSKEKMFTSDDLSVDYGYGFVVEHSPKGTKFVYHSGSWAGYYSVTFYMPQKNEYIVMLCNNEYKDFFSILNEILAARK